MNQNGTYNGLDGGINNGLYNGVDVGALGGATSGEKPLFSGLLNKYPNATAAYSLRKLSIFYTGPAIRVRRSSDNAEQDIQFAGLELDIAALRSFVGTDNGFITTWYSQGTTSNLNFTQTTQANQPRIVNAGVIDVRNERPSIFFDGTMFMDIPSSTASFNFLHQDGQSAVFIVFQAGIILNPDTLYSILNNAFQSNAIGYSLHYDDQSTTPVNNTIISFVNRGSTPLVSNNPSSDNYFDPNTLTLVSNLLDNSNATVANRNIIYKNGANELKNSTANGTPSTANASFNMRIGRRVNTTIQNLIGYISEIIIYPTNQSFIRTKIENNINNYYKIY